MKFGGHFSKIEPKLKGKNNGSMYVQFEATTVVIKNKVFSNTF